jgi:hypothetical protein
MIRNVNNSIPALSDTRPNSASARKRQESFQSTLQAALAQPDSGKPLAVSSSDAVAHQPQADGKPWGQMTLEEQRAYMRAYDAALDAQGDSTAARSWMLGWVPPADMTTGQLQKAYDWNSKGVAAAINDTAMLKKHGSLDPSTAEAMNWILARAQDGAAPYLEELKKRGVL